ncbi:MAG: hypothetical protein A2287_08875 [Candidatus Melainabacteria bacterium RIFOXYA12_FULL_32_12]|nr:MAG: hypothetical protein A2255_11125 [Candidatus Melainabacteria bacterium RIFOXYA2_FULL_32_9]OGI26517.1 MAG: hypothetical protein A2287_08875 [Candidatus Melainabacteria bacterium RIFOXYA12_FULL_32_12]
MFFSAYLGNKDNMSNWLNMINDYADWLGFDSFIEMRSINDERVFSFAWLRHKLSKTNIQFIETDGYIVLNTDCYPINRRNFATPWEYFTDNLDKNIIQLGISLNTGEIRVLSPLVIPEQFCFASDSRGWVLSNDIRLLLQWSDLDIDEVAVYSLFKYRSIPAPHTISKNIKCIPNAHILKILPDTTEPVFELSQEVREYIFTGSSSSDLGIKEKEFEIILDGILNELPLSSILFFSGGVDSTLLGLRLSEMNRSDVSLVNYTNGRNEPGDYLASEVSKYINLPFKQVCYDPSDISNMVNRIFNEYSFPFTDPSTLVANSLARSALKLSGGYTPAAIDGSGADCSLVGDIPVYHRYSKIYKMPMPIRHFAAEMYKSLNMWNYDSFITRPFRATRRSVLMPLQCLELSNVFDGIIFNTPDDTLKTIKRRYIDDVRLIFEGFNEENKRFNDYKYTSILNLIYASALSSASKTFDFLRMNGAKLILPFYDPKILRLIYSITWSQKVSEEPKAILKRMLAPQIPQNLINYPKQAFTPIYDILKNSEMKDFMYSTALDQNSPLSAFFDIKTTKRILDRLNHIDPDLFSLLWAITFTSAWINQHKGAFKNNYQLIS